MKSGLHRVFLGSVNDEDWVVVYLTLDTKGRVSPKGVAPRLAKTRWEGEDDWGEYEHRGGTAAFRWATGGSRLTTFGDSPVLKGSMCLIYETDDPSDRAWQFVVKDVRRV